MSLLGKDFEESMKKFGELISDAQLVVLNLNKTITKINRILDRLFNIPNERP